MSRNRPHDRCAACERTLAETGGVRLVATASHTLRVCTPDVPLGNLHHPARTIRLRGDYRDVIVVFTGEHLWTDRIVGWVERTVYEGARPWFCQLCAHSNLCPNCHSPLTTVPGTDRLDDDGRTVHSPHVTGYMRECPNPSCAAHGSGVREEDVSNWIDAIPFDPELNRRVDEMLGDDVPK